MRRQRRISRFGGAAALVSAVLLACASLLTGTSWAAVQYTATFPHDECTFSSTGRNLHFTVRPGDRSVLAGTDDGDAVRLQITVLSQTRSITFVTKEGESLTVTTRVVEEREWRNDEIVEVSRNFFARCTQTDDVYYFGEEVDIYENGVIVSHAGAWLAGKNGAQPGLIMPGTFLLGSRYFQEVAPGVALDRAEHVRMGLTLKTPAGTFRECVEVVETTPLEPGSASIKRYCPELGLVMDGTLKLVEFHVGGFDD
jgi:hypothetical protein